MQANDEYVQVARRALLGLKGTLLLACSDRRSEEAETCFHQALDVAHTPTGQVPRTARDDEPGRIYGGTRAGALRPTALLAPLYGWFTDWF